MSCFQRFFMFLFMSIQGQVTMPNMVWLKLMGERLWNILFIHKSSLLKWKWFFAFNGFYLISSQRQHENKNVRMWNNEKVVINFNPNPQK